MDNLWTMVDNEKTRYPPSPTGCPHRQESIPKFAIMPYGPDALRLPNHIFKKFKKINHTVPVK
jgi:hypothetical protein